jgi:hypothetical protein
MRNRTLPSTHIPETGITIRRLVADDMGAVTRLAQRDTASVPSDPVLGAEVDGRLLAAISTATGEVVADPFRPTAEIVDMLRLRVGQIDGRPGGRARKLLSFLRPAPRRRGARLAPSPPGAGGRILTLAGRTER